MRKITQYSLMLAGLATMSLAACNNSEMEDRVDRLEQRVAALEGNGGVAANRSTISLEDKPVQNAALQAETEGPAASFDFGDKVYDFGTVSEGEEVMHTYTFTNTGEAPLVIQSASASCGCTVPSYSKEPVPVGGKGEIQVKFNSANRSGVQNKIVTITANTQPAVTRLTLKGTVEKKAEGAGPVRN